MTQKCFHTRIRAGSTFHLYRLSEQITELIFRQAPGGCDWHMLLQENGITVHSVHSNTLRNAGNMNLFVQSPRSIVCFANLIYANRINSRSMSRVFCDLRSQKTPRGILPVNSNENAPHKMCVTICGRFYLLLSFIFASTAAPTLL